MFKHIGGVAATVAALLPMLAVAGPVNVNTADAMTIADELKGVGPTTARAIVEYRTQHGPFETVGDLANVKGIGLGLLEANRGDIRLTGDPDRTQADGN